VNLRERYEQEAAALWARLGRLGDKTQRLAGLYAQGADARVGRLVQSAAFAFAVAENRLQDDGQALVRPLVARALPESLRPRPSSTIVELTRAGAGRSGGAQGTTLHAQAGSVSLPFKVMWPAALAPIAIEDVVADRLDARRQVLRFALVCGSGTSLGLAMPDVVRLFVQLEPRAVALDVLHALRTGGTGRTVWLDAKGNRLADKDLVDAVRWVRIDTTEPPLVSARADRFASGTLLRDLFAMPESYCFLDVHLGPSREGAAHRVEVTLPLAYVVERAERLSLRLFCAPATNEFLAEIERLPDSPQQASLRVAGKPHAEILEVRRLAASSERDGGQARPLASWEAPDEPHAFDPEETYFTLEQRFGVEDRTELRAMFGTLDAMPSAPGGVVRGEVLASDGALTAGLGLGDVGSAREGGSNITRVVPSRRAVLGENHAWRLSAYARMPAGRLARRAHLAELLRLHDPFGLQDDAVWIPRPTILAAAHEQEHELAGGMLAWGDHYTLSLDPAGCTDGALWLVGELLHRALAERTEALRFARLSVRKGGTEFAEYPARQGVRFPFPLG
jgi:type VI protein secretion system component VasA